MNLDHNHEIVNRRLAQKKEFLGQDLTGLLAPATEENLMAYFDKNKDTYVTPYKYSLYQIIFTPDNHTNLTERAKTLARCLFIWSFAWIWFRWSLNRGRASTKGNSISLSFFQDRY
ncbi:peptidyl-prolyl cis-trans isomerase [Aestuariibaculum sediminum]|uniref:peptidyl-prolyl cis-trans isomerase n=1 Tax=Aestuariibaculum sediminum TaxID=2770637 RepID=UPI001CB6DDFB|nr:peptidyl-prolyl cis-trans isomerase [Aestuariibaculum sediminum]